MDNNIVFVRTGKGEDEVHSRTMHLPGNIKRALLMVDGTATYGEISKRAAPSLRADLEQMLQELERDGYIADKSRAGSALKTPVPPRMSMPTKMSVPPKIVTPRKPQVEDAVGDLDFMSTLAAPSPTAPETAVAAETPEADERAKQEIEAAKLKAQQEAEAMLEKAAQEAARIREEAEREKQRVAAAAKAEMEVRARSLIEAKAREEVEAARLRAEAEARERAEAIARQEIEAARVQAQREAEAARLKAEQEVARAREEAAAALKARQKAEAMLIKSVQGTAQAREQKEAEKPRPNVASTSRSTSATVLFFDVVGYTKQPVNKQIEIKKQFNQLVSACLKLAADTELIILDTGDGAAIGFLQHPEDALEVAIKFREAVVANQHLDYPELKVRMGIHLGPVNITKDMNGRSNMVGDGINDAQRVMSFAGIDQIFISRPYYDFVSRLRDEYADMFRYRGVQQDKHGREHPVYEFVGGKGAETGGANQGRVPAEEVQPNPFASLGQAPSGEKATAPFAFDAFQIGSPRPPVEEQASPLAQKPGPAVASGPGKPEAFSFDAFSVTAPQPPVEQPKPAEPPEKESLVAPQATVATASPAEAPSFAERKPAAYEPSQDEIRRAAQERIAAEKRMEEEKRREEEALAARKQAEADAKARAEAEKRAAEAARAESERTAREARHIAQAAAPAPKPAPAARARRKSFSLGKLIGFFLKLGVFALALLVVALFVVPYVLPMRDYRPKVETFISAKLHQPVHVGRLSARILPTPRLELGEIYVGKVKEFQAAQALVNFSFLGLVVDAKPIDSIELQGVTVTGAGLPGAPKWIQQIAADNQYPVARISMEQGTLDAGAFKLTGVAGTLEFNNIGQFTRASLRSNEGKYLLEITPSAGSKLKMDVSVRDNALPLLPGWHFDELSAKGELGNNELTIAEFKGQILGGVLQGNASINWRSGWVAQGLMTAKAVPMQRLNKLLDGNMEGSGRFKMSAVDLAGLADSAVLEGTFNAANGVISGMDVVATARAHSTEHLPGGRTRFDEMSGVVSYADDTLHIKQTKITSNALNAVAALDIEKQRLSGSVTVKLTLEEGAKPVELKIDGTTEIPSLRYAP